MAGTAGSASMTVYAGLDAADGAKPPHTDVARPPVADADAAPCGHVMPPAPVLCMYADVVHG